MEKKVIYKTLVAAINLSFSGSGVEGAGSLRAASGLVSFLRHPQSTHLFLQPLEDRVQVLMVDS